MDQEENMLMQGKTGGFRGERWMQGKTGGARGKQMDAGENM